VEPRWRTAVRAVGALLVAFVMMLGMMSSVSAQQFQPESPVGVTFVEEGEQAPAAASPFEGKTLVVMGGSYMSGFTAQTGPQFFPDTNVFEKIPGTSTVSRAYRSTSTFTVPVARNLGMGHVNLASAGAETKHILTEAQYSEVPRQLDLLEQLVQRGDDLVIVMQTRGNPHLGQTVACLWAKLNSCSAAELAGIQADLVGVAADEERLVFDEVKRIAPNAPIYSVGTPAVTPRPGSDIGPCGPLITPDEIEPFHDLEVAFNQSILEVATEKGATFVNLQLEDSPWVTSRHDVCSQDPWVWGPRFDTPPSVLDWTNPFSWVSTTLHPTPAGYTPMSTILEYAMLANPPPSR